MTEGYGTRVLVAMDAFKGALSQIDVGEALKRGLQRGYGADLTVELCPLADGGEGTGHLFGALGAQMRQTTVADAYGRPRSARWWIMNGLALVESAEATPYLDPQVRPAQSALTTTSRGTGQVIQAALADPAVNTVVVALGGTGSVDGGMGLLAELGAVFFDAQGGVLDPEARFWEAVASCRLPGLIKPVIALVDVLVPLLGSRGMLRGFGPQKGLTPDEIDRAEPALAHFGSVVSRTACDLPGAGAAGGMGFGLGALGVPLRSGAAWWAERVGLRQRVGQSQVVITGEGSLDAQSLWGKAVSVVLESAQEQHRPVIAVAGQLGHDLEPLYQAGLTAALAIGPGPEEWGQALSHTAINLERTGQSLGRLLRVLRTPSPR